MFGRILNVPLVVIVVQQDFNTFYYVNKILFGNATTQKIKFFIKDFFSKCDQIRRKLRIWSHLLKKSLNENFIFMQCAFVIFEINFRQANFGVFLISNQFQISNFGVFLSCFLFFLNSRKLELTPTSCEGCHLSGLLLTLSFLELNC